MSLAIHGLASAVPAHAMSQDQAAALACDVVCRTDQQRRLVNVLYRRSGVENRNTVLPHRLAMNWLHASEPDGGDAPGAATLGPSTRERMQYFAELAAPLALEAARGALAASGAARSEITHLVTVTCTGFAAPGVDTALVKELELRPTTQRVQVGFMGCHGAINGLRVAQGLAAGDANARVLLCAVELCSLHYRFRWDPERLVANAIFGDGAAALVGGAAIASDDRWKLLATGSVLLPDSADAMTWNIGDHGFEMTLQPQVPDLIEQHLRPWLEDWLAEHGLDMSSIGSWAVHPGGPRILAAVEEALGLPREATEVSREILARHGNMSSPTVLFILERLLRQAARRPCVALGFGPGMFAEGAIFV
jgi:predicted naringenin-chalcone synthase